MKAFNEFAGKRMPYKESDDYVARLIERSADRAISEAGAVRPRVAIIRWASVAASVAAVALCAVLLFSKLNDDSTYEMIQNSMSLSEVLNSLSEEELMCVSDYTIEDIPEYDE